ncbi:uncharacterized protein LOC116160285 [Photinus pyralis]|uniref:uncharacterized protein LOC116160285 n=1 Tax=Photinus pyralis TaxID=7054 RepID=UPI00126751CB|nr:uncharacterized protein LOC116160285 [Photinus pyralis]
MCSANQVPKHVIFYINGEEVLISDKNPEIRYRLIDEDDFAVSYIQDAIQNGIYDLDGELVSICRLEGNSDVKILLERDAGESSSMSVNDDNNIALEDGALAIQSWTEAPTKLLIELYNNYSPKVGKVVKLKNKKKMWEAIKDDMEKQNYTFTAAQIENRWKTLERSFKKKTENNNKTGRARASCPYERELTECFAKKSNVFPDFTLDRDGNGKNKSDIIKDADITVEVPKINSQPTENVQCRKSETSTSSHADEPFAESSQNTTEHQKKKQKELQESYEN